MALKIRTLGWVQNAAKIEHLKAVVKLFIYDSDINKTLRTEKIPRLITDKNEKELFIQLLSEKKNIVIPYSALKGKGKPNGKTRGTAPCSGIIQAAIPSQKHTKDYTDDWSSDCFLRWAIALGFLDYDIKTDSCSIGDLGMVFANTETGTLEEKEILGIAYLSYPPAVRVLSLLDKNGHLTKYEIGGKLGIIGEAGFTSISQNIILQGLIDAKTNEERKRIRANVEGDSDKYARMICGWFEYIGWVKKVPKLIAENIKIAHAYKITLNGKTSLKRALGASSVKKIPKIVYWEMLATKPSDKIYLRTRRAHIIQYIQKSSRTLAEIKKFLESKGLNGDDAISILDDIRSFENIGLTVKELNGSYRITDKIKHLAIPEHEKKIEKADITLIKDKIRPQLKTIDHKYLNLIDLSFDGKASRDFEIQTITLLINELEFKGLRLGEAKKPDGIVYYDSSGVIIDTKAYSKAYNLPQNQMDEMRRYIEENQRKDISINPNGWWKFFPDSISLFSFLFVSSAFTQDINKKIADLSRRSKISGAVINSQILLLLAEEIKCKRISYPECLEMFGTNKEITVKDILPNGLNP